MLVVMMVLVAVSTGLINIIFFPSTALLGASGVIFAMILLSSITGDGRIPLTFILVVLLFMGQQVYEGITAVDQISQLSHILGGIVGAAFGFIQRERKGRRDAGRPQL